MTRCVCSLVANLSLNDILVAATLPALRFEAAADASNSESHACELVRFTLVAALAPFFPLCCMCA